MRTIHKTNDKIFCIESDHGIVKKLWEIKDESEIEKEPQDGMFLQYYASGYVAISGQYKNGRMDGEWKYFHGNGELKNLFTCKDGIMHGDYIEVNEGGVEIINGHYENGLKTGKWTWKYDSGEIKETGSYKDDLLDGEFICYYKNGNIREKGKYSKGELHGAYETYFNDGSLRAKGTNVKGKPRRITTNSNIQIIINKLNKGEK